MASGALIRAIENYENFIERKGIEERVLDAYYEALKIAYLDEKDIAFGREISGNAKIHLFSLIEKATNGGNFKWLEEWSQENKEPVGLINRFYDILLLEAPYVLDSYMLYVEKNRLRRERFYTPRRRVLKKVTDSLQCLEEDRLDELFIHMPARVGKLLADDTLVLTSNGWKNHGDLVVGDKVVGSNSEYTEVTKVFPKDYADRLVILSNGEEFCCHHNHEWVVYDGEWHNYETHELQKRFRKTRKFYLRDKGRFNSRNPRISKVYIKEIRECEKKRGNCISVASLDGLYAIGRSLTLTHNSQEITMYSGWHCARDTEKSNLYVTYKEDLGGAYLDGVMELLTDPTYCHKDVFPDTFIADTDAKAHKLDLGRAKKYKTLSGKGLTSGLNGEYDAYGVMILDDVLEGVQDVLSPLTLKRKQIVFDNNVMSRAKESCKIIYNGTIWATNDLFMSRLDFLENNPAAKSKGIRYQIIKIPALDPETDESNFDYDYGVGYSTAYYRARRAKFEMNGDLAGWFAQCQQEPIDRTGAVFSPDQMRYYKTLPEEEPLKIISHCDVALGGGDYLSFPVIYVYEDGSMFLEDVVFDNSEKHITQPQIIQKIIRHKMRNLHFESNQGGEGYKDDIAQKVKDAPEITWNVNISSDWAPSNMRKEQRIWDHAEQIRQIYYKEPGLRDEHYRKFMNNLFSFTMVHSKRKQDDAPDSLAGAIDFEEHGSGVHVASITGSWI